VPADSYSFLQQPSWCSHQALCARWSHAGPDFLQIACKRQSAGAPGRMGSRAPPAKTARTSLRARRAYTARAVARPSDTGQGRRALAAHTPQVPRAHPRSAAAFQSIGMFPGQRGSAASPRRGARRGQGRCVRRPAAARPSRARPGELPQDAVARSLAQVVADLAARQPPLCCYPAWRYQSPAATAAGRGLPEHELRRVRPGRPRPSRPSASGKIPVVARGASVPELHLLAMRQPTRRLRLATARTTVAPDRGAARPIDWTESRRVLPPLGS
jgi:hypothetical protein